MNFEQRHAPAREQRALAFVRLDARRAAVDERAVDLDGPGERPTRPPEREIEQVDAPPATGRFGRQQPFAVKLRAGVDQFLSDHDLQARHPEQAILADLAHHEHAPVLRRRDLIARAPGGGLLTGRADRAAFDRPLGVVFAQPALLAAFRAAHRYVRFHLPALAVQAAAQLGAGVVDGERGGHGSTPSHCSRSDCAGMAACCGTTPLPSAARRLFQSGGFC